MTSGRVLLFEDDAALRAVLQESFEDEGLQVSVCPSYGDLLAAAQQDPGSVVVADSWNSGDHQTLSAQQRQEILALSAEAVVILTTGRGWAHHVAPDQLGGALVLPKPYDLDLLIQQVLQTLARTDGA